MPSTKTYLSELVSRAYFLVGLFAAAFYALCFAHSKQYISAFEAISLIGAYWIASTLYFAKAIFDRFSSFYKMIVKRMRLYSATRFFLQFYVLGALLVFPVLAFVIPNYDSIATTSIDSCSMKRLLSVYGASLFGVFYIFTVISKVITEMRGTRSSK